MGSDIMGNPTRSGYTVELVHLACLVRFAHNVKARIPTGQTSRGALLFMQLFTAAAVKHTTRALFTRVHVDVTLITERLTRPLVLWRHSV
jgi:hypothetical protein